jgi:16S rRNA processing protein RimM
VTRVGILLFFESNMNISDCYKIGYILKPHGLKGEVTISVDAEAPENLDVLEAVFIELNQQLVPHFLEAISVRGEKAFVKFEDVNTHEAALAISKSGIFLPKSSRPKSGRGEFYDDEVIGFEVIEVDGNFLGNVTSIEEAGPNKLIAVDHNGKEVLIPVNSPFITSINKSKKKITVDLPDGFLEI